MATWSPRNTWSMGQWPWALHGHISAPSIKSKVPGQRVAQGDVIGWMGDKHET